LAHPQRRRRLGAPHAPPHGGAPGRGPQRRGLADEAPPRRQRKGRRDRPGPERGDRDLAPVPQLLRSLRRPLPQPRPRGPQHDVRLGDPPVRIGTARSLSLAAGARPIASPEMLDKAAVLSRREATLRAAATPCLVGIALVQAIGLAYPLAQGTPL